MKRTFVLFLAALTLASLPACAQTRSCQNIGGALMTTFNLLPYGPEGGTNLGPAFGDLAGSVAATAINTSPFTFQHYWMTTTGDVVNFKPAVLKPTPTSNQNVMAIQWGDYRAVISGGTGKFAGATGYIDAFGLIDMKARTVVLRYRGVACYVVPVPPKTVTATEPE